MMLKHEKKCLDLWLRQCQIKGSIKDRSRESRIFFGTLLAQELNAGFIPVRKLTNCLTKPFRQLMI
jgi:hypothetical protein